MPRTYVALDLEFTGLDSRRDEIIEIGMVKFRGTEVLDTFSSLVNSRRPIPYKIQQLSGIDPDEVAKAPSLASLRAQVLGFVANHPLVGHSIEMDLRFLNRAGPFLRNLAIDTFEMATIFVPEVRVYSLVNLANALGIEVVESHRALADAEVTKELFIKLLERAEAWDMSTLQEITRLSQNSDWPLLRIFRDIIADRQEAMGAQLLVTRKPKGQDSLALPPEKPLTPLRPSSEITPIDSDDLEAAISPDGPFARRFPGYEYRPQQVEMLRAVAEAINIPTHLLVEAGTGTGKSLAYLLPAATFAMQNDRRVVISSNTINLQDQLFTKDIPDLEHILGLDLRAALLKGRGNYLCLRRLAQFRRSRTFSPEQARVLAKVIAWLPTTHSGDRSELLLVNSDLAIWPDLQSTPETCMGEHCPFRQSGECFFYRARVRAENSHLVVVNHALLLTDLAMDNRILPEYKYVIIDEAHHLEEQATNQFGLEVSRQGTYAYLNSVSHSIDGAPGGLVSQIPRVFQSGISQSTQQAITALITEIKTHVDSAERRLYSLFQTLTHFVQEHAEGQTGRRSAYNTEIRLTSAFRIQPGWDEVEIAAENLTATLAQITSKLTRIVTRLEADNSGEDSDREEMVQEIKASLLHGTEIHGALDGILMQPSDESIYWITIVQRTDELELHSAPLHVGSILEERLFMENDCVILTSATLRTAGTFSYIKERLSMEDPIEVALDSPFDYKSSLLLYVPKDIPEPNQPYYQKTTESALIDLCKATDGRALILFTSNSQLNTTYRAIQPSLDAEGIAVFGQGIDGSRRQILDSFRNTPRSVLLGTRSFWEGVDVVGQALSCLVITRLPFSVPTDPIFASRAETFQDPFNEYYLPEAILRFRQGFGRLIRSTEDFGIVVVLDKRILTKAYGKTILRSLPPCTARQGPVASLPSVAQRWLDPANRE